MAQVSGAVQWQCDRCGATPDMTLPGVVPEGWLSGTGLRNAETAKSLNDLCGNCAGLPVREAIQPCS